MGQAQIIVATADTGAAVKVTVKADSAGVVPVAAGQSYRVTTKAGLYGSVSMSVPGKLASFAVNPPNPLAAAIEVYPK